jgi:hypothetical protein
VMGRPARSLFDPVPKTPEEIEAEEKRRAELEEKAARIQAMHFEAVMRRDHPERIVDPEPEP